MRACMGGSGGERNKKFSLLGDHWPMASPGCCIKGDALKLDVVLVPVVNWLPSWWRCPYLIRDHLAQRFRCFAGSRGLPWLGIYYHLGADLGLLVALILIQNGALLIH